MKFKKITIGPPSLSLPEICYITASKEHEHFTRKITTAPTTGQGQAQVRSEVHVQSMAVSQDTTVDNKPSNKKAHICEHCQKIKFSTTLVERIPSLADVDSRKTMAQGAFISELGHFSASCTLCNEFNSAKTNIQDGRDESYSLRAFRFPTSYYDPERLSRMVNPPRTAWLQPMPRDGYASGLSLESIAGHARANGWTACCLTDDGKGMFRPQPVFGKIDAFLIKRWLSACKQTHNSCNASSNMRGLILIDCTTLQLCCATTNDSYVALSYVWAKPAPGAATDITSQVVMDAISVTKQLDFRYLWIDKYCIDQHDAATKQHQIENMDLIYQGAECTIIAAAGEDEHYGLSGVSVERNPQRVVEIGRYTVVHMPPEPWCATLKSRWSTRAWVRDPDNSSIS
jgi:hypothetical protein